MTQTTVKEDSIVALVTKIENTNGANIVNITNGLVQVMMAGARFPGFWSGEIIPPEDTTHNIWKLVQRFASSDQAKSWQAAPSRVDMIKSMTSADNSSAVEVSDEIAEHLPYAEVATAIATEVKPEMEDAYFAWEVKIQSAQARFPGYRGSYLQPPAPGRPGRWSTLLRFDTPESLEQWFSSSERQTLIKEASKFVKATHFQDVSNSFPGWFPVDKNTGKGPPNWKTAMLVLLGLFPVVMLEIRFLSPLLASLNSGLSSFLNLVLSVILTTWGTMPFFITWFTWWLLPKEDEVSSTNIKGTLIMVALFTIEVAALWNLLPPRT